jgi:N-acyl-D-aspartate/D-glutamate deacylase
MNGRFHHCARRLGLIFLLLPAFAAAQAPDYDFIISGAHMVDGTGAPWVEGDIAIAGDRIVAIGDLSKASARKRLDAKGLVVSPGFIDVQGQSEFNVLVDNRAASKITQGVTTEITGEGSSIAPVNDRMKKENEEVAKKYGVTEDWSTLDEYFKHFERTKSAINLGTFVGAGGVRNYVMGTVNRPASPAELEQMRQLVAQAMQDGAMGISTALEYVPDTFASTDEIVELAKVARQYGGREMDQPSTTWENEWLGSGGDGSGIMLVGLMNPELAEYEGMTLQEIGRQWKKDPKDVAMEIVIADHGRTGQVISIMDEGDVRAAVSNSIVTYGSDSEAQAEDGPLSKTKAHPRAFGTFPRILGIYAREQQMMSLEEAVRKMTSLAASRVGLLDRGILRPGAFADIAVFDPKTIRDVATFSDPMHYSVGVRYVFVNGRPVVWGGAITDERPGRPVRGAGYQAKHR